MFDLLIRNAQIVDGSGGPPFAGSLAVQDGIIAALGEIPVEAQAAQIVDGSGLVLSPGFIDIHTHADVALLSSPAHLPKIMQGVTTEVFTNCGLGFAPCSSEALVTQREYLGGLFGPDPGVPWNWNSVGEFLGLFEKQGMGTNIAYLIPHGSVRVSVTGMEQRTADTGEIEKMVALVREGMDQGAWGMSTGLWYAPMSSAGRDENVALFKAGGFFATHQRDYGDQIFEATEESIDIAREADVPVQISHLQMNGPLNKDRASELLAFIEERQRSGVDVTCDTYPYTAGSTFMQTILPSWTTDGGPDAILRRLANNENRNKAVAEIAASGRDWSKFALSGANSNENRDYEGMWFNDIAADRNLTVAEWICNALVEESLQVCFVHHAAHESNVRTILQWPDQMIGSDGLHLPGKCHPRLFGTFVRVLGKYVRDERTISIEEAIRKMTSAPAQRLGLPNRGLLKPGFAADLVLFDPATVSDTASFADPRLYPQGIPNVWVNGIAAKQNGAATMALAGQVLRKR